MKQITILRKAGKITIECAAEDDVLEVIKEHEIKNIQSVNTEFVKEKKAKVKEEKAD